MPGCMLGALLACMLALPGRRRGAGLAGAAGHHGGAVRRRRSDRHRSPASSRRACRELLGQQIVVENVGGAGGMAGREPGREGGARRLHVPARQPGAPTPSASSSTRSRSTTRSTDFAPGGLFVSNTKVLVARKDLPVGHAAPSSSPMPKRTRPRCSTARPASARRPTSPACCSTPGMGTNITHVPYRGTGPAMQDLMAGRIDFMCDVISTALRADPRPER